MLSTLAWGPLLLTLLPHAFKFLLEALTKSMGDKPRRGKQELHHRLLLDLHKVEDDASVYGQQIKRLLLDELVRAAKKDPAEAASVLRLKNWRELVSRTDRVANLIEIKTDDTGVPRVLWAKNWFRFLKGRPLLAILVAFAIYLGGLLLTAFMGISFALAWHLEGWQMPSDLMLLLPAMLFSGTVSLFGFRRSEKILDAWSACRYAARLSTGDLVLPGNPPAPPRLELKARRAAPTAFVVSR